MRTPLVLLAGAALTAGLAAPAAAADKVPVKLKLTTCDGCRVAAFWSKDGGVDGPGGSANKAVRGDKALTFNVPKGYYIYFTVWSSKSQVDAATVLVTQYVGAKRGSSVSLKQATTLTRGAHYCMRAKKRTIKARATFVTADGTTLLLAWANPQLKRLGPATYTGDMGMYGTQGLLLCKGA